MSTTLVQPFSAGATPILQQLLDRLRMRLNAGANQAQLWTAQLGALALSTAGAYQVTVFFVGEKAGPSMQIQGQEAVARSIATRIVTVTVETRAVDERAQGLTADDYKTAERVQHSLIYCLDEKFGADFGYGDTRWNKTTASPLAPNVVLQQDITLLIQVHDDAYAILPITSTTTEGVLGDAPTP